MLVAIALAAVAGLGAGLGTMWLSRSSDPFAPCRTSAVAGGAGAIGGPFTLVSEDGATVTEADILAGPALVYFGYTFCPDICPIDSARNAEAVDLLAERGHVVTPVLITVDPDRDTPQVLAEYTDYMHPRMIGLTGSPEQIAEAARAYKVFYRKMEAEDEFYLVDHTAFSYLMLPGVGFADFFRRDMPADRLADRIACYLDAV
ncbi:MAG: SCO family protein [Rhodobacteraceae bacterium]|nr:SCO family protein [Paracoccaceae bacterium]